jgi:alkylation response protein AidB-like acyl-CoA dehydrogenase
MSVYKAPLQDMEFIFNEVLQVQDSEIPGYKDLDNDFLKSILNEAGKICSDILFPLNHIGDNQGCSLENGIVRTPEGFKEAFNKIREDGWTTIDCDTKYGGQGLPYIVGTAIGEMMASSNMAFGMYHGLTHGAYSAIHTHGTDQQKLKYLPKLVTCEWTGTMNLTEPQCGTDLGLMRTKAEPQNDGTYKITGQKIFISAGDHDLSENIIHLVLAKIPKGPEGIKGISMFIVPKILVKEDGSLGDHNKLSVGKIEVKMGIHGNSTCVMNYDGATGFLIGDEHKGMRAMFTMMNEARLGVGLQGYSQAEVAFQNATAYSKDRLQGRNLLGKSNKEGPADPIIVHPDIRRSLMDQKSFVEGARACTFWGAQLIDAASRSDDHFANGLISLLTPVLKGFLTDKGFEMTVQAQQIFGGHGYIEEWGMSQYVRDARIAMIYEGANGIQALDLVGRKLPQDNGKYILEFFALIARFIKENESHEGNFQSDFIEPLSMAISDLQSAGEYFLKNGQKNPLNVLAGSNDFMHLFGHVCLGFMWARMAKSALECLSADIDDAAFYDTKLKTGRYYMRRHLPATSLHLARITSGAECVMALQPDEF